MTSASIQLLLRSLHIETAAFVAFIKGRFPNKSKLCKSRQSRLAMAATISSPPNMEQKSPIQIPRRNITSQFILIFLACCDAWHSMQRRSEAEISISNHTTNHTPSLYPLATWQIHDVLTSECVRRLVFRADLGRMFVSL